MVLLSIILEQDIVVKFVCHKQYVHKINAHLTVEDCVDISYVRRVNIYNFPHIIPNNQIQSVYSTSIEA